MRRLAFVALACVAAVAAAAAAAHGSRTESPNVAVFPQTAHPYGADMATWGERATQWVYAQPLDRTCRRHASRLAIAAQKAALAHARLRREAGERQVASEVFGKPAVQVGKAVVGRLQRERRTELRLSARPLEEHHEIARDAEREPAAEILLHQR